MKIRVITYNGKDPIVVPPDHTVLFLEGSRIRCVSEEDLVRKAMAVAARVSKAVEDAEKCSAEPLLVASVDGPTPKCNVPGCFRPKYGKLTDRCWEHLSQGAEPASAECSLDSRIIDKAMLRESFNLACKDTFNYGTPPSAFYAALEKHIFGDKT